MSVWKCAQQTVCNFPTNGSDLETGQWSDATIEWNRLTIIYCAGVFCVFIHMKKVPWRHSPVGGKRQTTFEAKNGPFKVQSDLSIVWVFKS